MLRFEFNSSSLSLLLLIVFTASLPAEETVPTITVSGSAEIMVVPDKAILTFSIQSREKTAGAAVQDNNEKVKSVVDFLKTSGIEAKDISTQVITIRPVLDNDSHWRSKANAQAQMPVPQGPFQNPLPAANKKKLEPLGFTAQRQIALTVRKLSDFETIYLGLVTRGVNEVGGIQFQSSDMRKHRDEARLKAIRAAKEKATDMAAALGSKLASVRSITEGADRGWRPVLQNSFTIAPGDETAGLAAGMIQISASVNVVFILKETELSE